VFLFLKRKTVKRHFTAFMMIAAVIFSCLMMCGMTAYAAPIPNTGIEATTEPETEYDYSTEPDEIVTGDPVEIDAGDFIDPDRQPNQLTPPGNLTLVDDLSGAQANEKQFITVTTKSGATFYIIIDRSGNKENVYFLNLVDEADLLAIMEKDKKAATTTTPPATADETPGQSPAPDKPAPEQKGSNNTGLLIMFLVTAAVGGGAFYYFKILKPKQGGGKKSAVKSELDEFV
jgi:hypothetical protein